MKELSARKNTRLKGYDYSSCGAYFVTICIKDGHELLGRIVGGGFHAAPQVQTHAAPQVQTPAAPLVQTPAAPLVQTHAAPQVQTHAAPQVQTENVSILPNEAHSSFSIVKLTDIGNEVINSIEYISNKFDNVTIDKYVVMPNHVHLIVLLTGGHGNPPLPSLVGQLKSFTTKKWNDICKTHLQEIWQRSYYDRIIRNEEEHLRIRQYIDENPARWREDKYYLYD